MLTAISEQLKEGPEQQLVVGPLVEYLIKEKGYKLGQIFFGKNEWRVPKNPSEAARREKGTSYEGFPVDIAVFSDEEHAGDPQHLRIIVETKAPDESAGIGQLQIYMGLEPAVKLGIWTNSADPTAAAWFLYAENLSKPRKRQICDIPLPHYPISFSRDPLRLSDLVTPSHETLRKLFEEILDGLASRDPYAVRPEERLSELCNLILLKLESDRKARGRKEENPAVDWQLRENKKATAKWARDSFACLTELYPDLFDSEEQKTIRLSDDSICMIVEALERYQLLEAGSEAVSHAFQILRIEALRSADGQFFTPGQVIRAGTALVKPAWDDLILDPACGTGGFLMEALLKIKSEYPEEASRWAQTHIYGVDRDAMGVKLAKAVMQIAGDGSAHIFRGDSLRSHEWGQHFPRLKHELREGRFTLILTNPPFGQNLRVSSADLQASGYTIHQAADEKQHNSHSRGVEIGLVFLEQAYRLLRPGGRLGIVLPETYFFSPSYHWLFDWLRPRFRPVVVANIPMEAFQQYARAKTNFYVFEKIAGNDERTESAEVVFLNPKTCGISPSGGTLYKKTPQGDVVDDELWEHTQKLLKGDMPPGAARIPLKEVWPRKILVPNYYDPRYLEEFEILIKEKSLRRISLGDLVEKGLLGYRFGHGSPGRVGREGEVPYIKVSDLRAMRVNVNPTNMVPRELAKRFWKGNDSGLRSWDLLTPIRASSNIGEFAILLPGEEERVLTREILVLRSLDFAVLSPFYLLWALSLRAVRNQWRRITLMQTNREDVADRWKEVCIPDPASNSEWAEKVAQPLKEYFDELIEARKKLAAVLEHGFSFIPSLEKLARGQTITSENAEALVPTES